MSDERNIFLGKGETAQQLNLRLANRHGLIAGATGTGKTVSLQVLAEGFSAQGVPVFMADVKGDLSGISQPGIPHPKLQERAVQVGMTDYFLQGFPTIYWDLFGEQGHPIRTTISNFGPLMLARMLELNETQEGVLNIVFKLADDQGMLLLDLKDLRSMLAFVADSASSLTTDYGNVSKTTVGTIQRQLLILEQQGVEHFFGEPALDLRDLMRTNARGEGFISVLSADKLMRHPKLYSTFLLWLLAELFEELPEVGDLEKPKLVFFFDEAHLLFNDAPKSLVEKMEQVVRLIRSKGVGVYFISQSPLDIPETVLGQLSNRIQHGLRAFTPKDQKAVRTAAQTFRANPKFDATSAIMELGVGEALVSMLEPTGSPSIVQRLLMAPPRSRLGSASSSERQSILQQSPVHGRYEKPIDRESAYEILKTRIHHPPLNDSPVQPKSSNRGNRGQNLTQDLLGAVTKNLVSTIGSSLGRKIARGLLGSILK